MVAALVKARTRPSTPRFAMSHPKPKAVRHGAHPPSVLVAAYPEFAVGVNVLGLRVVMGRTRILTNAATRGSLTAGFRVFR
jgi:hypothetical protein